MSDANAPPPSSADDAAGRTTDTTNVAEPYLTIAGLAVAIGLALLIYLWSERDEIVRILSVSPI
jgi:hypothetical protein